MRPSAFMVRDCALVAISTGKRAETLREFRGALLEAPLECVYFQFWGRLLRPRLDDTEYHNDFAVWANQCLGDQLLAERLAIIDPADFADLESLRNEVAEIVEERLDDAEPASARRHEQFHFRRCQTVVFDTGRRLSEPALLASAVPAMSVGSIYYHLIDARRRDPVRIDDFRSWLQQWGGAYDGLCSRLAGLDPYFSSLAALRSELAALLAESFPERRG